RRPALVGAVVPLQQVVTGLALVEPGEPTRVRGPRQGAGQHPIEMPPAEPDARLLGLTAPVLVERHVGPPSVSSGAAPLGGAVGHQGDLLGPTGGAHDVGPIGVVPRSACRSGSERRAAVRRRMACSRSRMALLGVGLERGTRRWLTLTMVDR